MKVAAGFGLAALALAVLQAETGFDLVPYLPLITSVLVVVLGRWWALKDRSEQQNHRGARSDMVAAREIREELRASEAAAVARAHAAQDEVHELHRRFAGLESDVKILRSEARVLLHAILEDAEQIIGLLQRTPRPDGEAISEVALRIEQRARRGMDLWSDVG